MYGPGMTIPEVSNRRLVFVAFAGAALLATVGPSAISCGSSKGGSAFVATSDGGLTADSEGPPACPSAKTACNGVCVDTTNDPANCGGCGTTCGSNALCCSAVCVETATCAFAVTGVSPLQPDQHSGNQNGGDYFTVTGAGFVPGMQVYIGDGACPARTLDAQHATIQTPPGPVGTQDVKIVAAAGTATLPSGFRYTASGLLQPWQEKPMSVVRGEDPALAVLQDGRVLIAGGTTVPDHAENALTSAEIYTRSTDTVTSAANAMSVTRWHDGAITMLTGKVLVVGGAQASILADVFDPSTNAFSPTLSQLNTARSYVRSILMVDGRVMIASASAQTAEIYDPDKGSFSQIPLQATHTFGFIVRLRDGRIMLGGGDGGSVTNPSSTAVEIFDPAKGAFKMAGGMLQGRSMLTAHTLPDGRVMVIGGSSFTAGGVHAPLAEVEFYDPKTDAWTVAPFTLTTGRTWHASALVRDGTVIVMGGYNVDKTCTPTNTVDQIDPVKGTVTVFAALPHPNTEWTAVTLLDGSVLGVGGGACGTPLALPDIDFLPGAPSQQ
jgi:hypothetical protein